MNAIKRLKLGTRESKLAVLQAQEWIQLFKKNTKAAHGIIFEIVTYKTSGDIDKTTPLADMENSDFFTDSLDKALLLGEVDLVVHSAKDLPQNINADIEIAAITRPGGRQGDVLVLSKEYKASLIDELPSGMIIGTSSIRRKKQISSIRPDWILRDIRGNIEERLAALHDGYYDAIVMADIALYRLKLKEHCIPLDFPHHPLQARLAVTCRKSNKEIIELCSSTDDRKNWGELIIAGAGAGTKDLLPVITLRELERCDSVFYDQLISPDILTGLEAELIPCGRRKGKEILSTDIMADKILKRVFSGKKVVRLKGGDPMLFSRIADELDILREARISYKIIPGISAYQAASAFAELPLTSRYSSAGLFISTAYPIDRAIIPNYNSRLLLVYYMVTDVYKSIAIRLLEQGWPSSTPFLFVSNAGRVGQKLWQGKLQELISSDRKVLQPAVLFVGQSLLDGYKSWWDKEKKILVTGTDPDKWRDTGTVVHIPCINLKKIESSEVNKAYEKLKSYDTIIFTSKHAVCFFMEGLLERGKDSRALYDKKIIAIGKVTEKELLKYALLSDFIPDKDSAEGLLLMAKTKKWKGKNILIPSSTLSYPTLRDGLLNLGNIVDAPAFYDNVKSPYPEGLLLNVEDFDMLVFTSPSCVYRFIERFKAIPPGKDILTPGETTRRAVQDATAKTIQD
ncbi:hydroxymethylbilane synthase [Spirochaetia bacterium 38H-sp]|uniref:Hydroxymethylbilane synthase n=1 Tax=Rarispira pelagica TaxID=3141764 RepID=A0ABU9U9T2_9SPIR